VIVLATFVEDIWGDVMKSSELARVSTRALVHIQNHTLV
jgi:hypothetical protein